MVNCSSAQAASVHLGWDALADPSVIAYRIHFGGASGHYTNRILVATGSSAVASNLIEGGTYYFVVTSLNNSGIESLYSDEISWHVPLPVTVYRNGSGTVTTRETPATGSSPRMFTLTATPVAGMIFAGWTGSLVSLASTFTFVWTSNIVLQANFVPNPYPAVQGAYNGLFSETDRPTAASSGMFSVSVGPGGAYSGRVQISTNRLPFSGRLNPQCQATTTVARPSNSPLTLH